MSIVADRICEITDCLSENYGKHCSSYGGFIIFFDSIESFENLGNQVKEYYGLGEDMYEYRDNLSTTNNISWIEELFIVSTENSIVLIYPERVA